MSLLKRQVSACHFLVEYLKTPAEAVVILTAAFAMEIE